MKSTIWPVLAGSTEVLSDSGTFVKGFSFKIFPLSGQEIFCLTMSMYIGTPPNVYQYHGRFSILLRFIP